MAFNCKIMDYGSLEQLASVELRREILRKPLGLDFTDEELMEEMKHIHVGCFTENGLVGVLILVRVNFATLKMRQVAVASNMQGQGVGKAMVGFAEQWAKDKGYYIIELNARETAVPFYLVLDYSINGDGFIEIGIPHYKMIKDLD